MTDDQRREAAHEAARAAVSRWIASPDDDAKAERGLRDVLHALSVVPAGERRDLRRKAGRRKARAAC